MSAKVSGTFLQLSQLDPQPVHWRRGLIKAIHPPIRAWNKHQVSVCGYSSQALEDGGEVSGKVTVSTGAIPIEGNLVAI